MELSSEQNAMKDYFDSSAGLDSDDCALLAQNVQNQRIMEYSLWNTMDPYCTTNLRSNVQQFAVDTGRSYRDGYGGVPTCVIDDATRQRLGETTSMRGRIPLNTRVFQGVENLSRGVPKPDIESRIFTGELTQSRRACDGIGEVSIERFDPLLPCIMQTIGNPRNYTNGHRIGVATRDIDFQREFLKQSGYEYSGKYWVKKYCDNRSKTPIHG